MLTSATALLLGCGRYFAPDINLSRFLKESDVIGTWILTSNTLILAKKDGYVPLPESLHQITIGSNGVCQFSSIVEFGERVQYVEGDGQWQINHDTEGRKNRLQLRISTKNETRDMSFDFTEEKNTIYLWDFWGDPDSWEFLKYKSKVIHRK